MVSGYGQKYARNSWIIGLADGDAFRTKTRGILDKVREVWRSCSSGDTKRSPICEGTLDVKRRYVFISLI